MNERRHFEDYKHSESRTLIAGLQQIQEAGYHRHLDSRDKEFIFTVTKRHVYDYELSEKQQYVARKILGRYGRV